MLIHVEHNIIVCVCVCVCARVPVVRGREDSDTFAVMGNLVSILLHLMTANHQI